MLYFLNRELLMMKMSKYTWMLRRKSQHVMDVNRKAIEHGCTGPEEETLERVTQVTVHIEKSSHIPHHF